MTLDTQERQQTAQRFTHEAAFYHGMDGMLQTVVPFVVDGLSRGESILVALLPDRIEALHDALGPAAAGIEFVDMAELGRNPARIIPAWRRFVDEAPVGTALRGVGEPIWAARREVEITECRLHEALLNVAFDDGPPWRLMCPYDAEALPTYVVRDAMRTHPVVNGGEVRPVRYEGHDHALDEFAALLPAPPARAQVFPFGAADLGDLRDVVAWLATHAGLGHDRAGDLVLAAHELATNSIQHGGGGGVLAAWVEPDALVVDIRDAGVIDDVMVGREQAFGLDESGRGVWMANQLCDLVQVRSTDRGVNLRLYAWL